MKYWRYFIIALSAFLYLAGVCIISVIYSKIKHDKLISKERRHDLNTIYLQIFAYSFLFMFILMAAVNIALIYQLRKRNNRISMSLDSPIEGTSLSFDTEIKALLLILLFFEVSYLVRFTWD